MSPSLAFSFNKNVEQIAKNAFNRITKQFVVDNGKLVNLVLQDLLAS